uniref:Uncharacterized protein n=1 Tax=Amphimedon queenslandica TaxID=400682 RepID=A0A1X7T3L4_AMPQE
MSTSISVTCSFRFSNVGFAVLRIIKNIHILMGQGLKKLTIGNLTLWRRQDVRQKSRHLTIGEIAGGDEAYYYFRLFLETRKENETFKKYSCQGINLKKSVVDLSTGEVGPAKLMRGEGGWTVQELKQHIGEVFNINSSCMRLVMDYTSSDTSVRDISDVGSTNSVAVYVSSNPKDYQKEYKYSLMYRYVDLHVNSVRLNITLPPQTEATLTTTNVTEGGMMIKMIFLNEENKGKGRSNVKGL